MESEAADLARSPVIYGTDTRVEYHEASARQQRWSDATALLTSHSGLENDGGGLCTPSDEECYLLVDSYELVDGDGDGNADEDLCSTVAFYGDRQSLGGYCSGFLVGPDLAVTAGHCIESTADCSDTTFVFGFHNDIPGADPELYFGKDDRYRCQSVVSRGLAGDVDYAVVKLDRVVTGRIPFRIRYTGIVPTFDNVTLIGHPSALSKKIDPGGSVYWNEPADVFFEASVDAIGGNSGSAVINAATGVVEGILVSGNTDYVQQGSCYVEQVCNESGCDNLKTETISSIAQAKDHVPLHASIIMSII